MRPCYALGYTWNVSRKVQMQSLNRRACSGERPSADDSAMIRSSLLWSRSGPPAESVAIGSGKSSESCVRVPGSFG